MRLARLLVGESAPPTVGDRQLVVVGVDRRNRQHSSRSGRCRGAPPRRLFAKAASSLGPAIHSIEGLMALLPVAIDHVARGVATVVKAQGELASDAAKLLADSRHTAPKPVPAPVDHQRDGDGHHGDGRHGDHREGDDKKDASLAITLPNGRVVYAPNARAAKAVI